MKVLPSKNLKALRGQICLLLHAAVPTHVKAKTGNEYFNMDLAQLMQVSTTLMSKKTQNLLYTSQLKYTSELITPPTKIDRGVYGKVTWSF